jgi:hypothetical protein
VRLSILTASARRRASAITCAEVTPSPVFRALPRLLYSPPSSLITEEMFMYKASAAALTVVLVSFAGSAPAQEQTSFRSLIGKGYDIKAVTFAHGESIGNRGVFVVTLQLQKSVAVCYFAAPSWINLSNQALDDTKRCDVR